MSDLMQISMPTPDQDWSVLFSMGSSGPQLAELKLNKAESVEHNNKKYPVSSPGIKIENAAFGEAYATDVRVRIFFDTMQTSVFDQEEGKYTNFSQHFKAYDQTALDWFGGDKCGWIKSAERNKLKGTDPIAFANASRAKLSRNIFGLVSMGDAKSPDGKKVEVEEVPFRMKLGPSNFYSITETYSKMVRAGANPHNHQIQFNYRIDKKGSNSYIVLEYEPLYAKSFEMTPENKETFGDLREVINVENERVREKMRENMVSVMEDEFKDVVDAA